MEMLSVWCHLKFATHLFENFVDVKKDQRLPEDSSADKAINLKYDQIVDYK